MMKSGPGCHSLNISNDMVRQHFRLADIQQECQIVEGSHTLDGQRIGMTIHVPKALQQQYPFNASAYAFLQELRHEILHFGLIEFPHLPVNKTNYTLAQRDPQQHSYSTNTYLTDECQALHQDTPPYPTAFWLNNERRHSATWIVSTTGLQDFLQFRQQHPQLDMLATHEKLVPQSLQQGTGLLLNRKPGLLLIDNSQHCSLYHARTCCFDNKSVSTSPRTDTPMYAFNEVGLLNYIDMLDSRRGNEHRDAEDLQQVKTFMQQEPGF